MIHAFEGNTMYLFFEYKYKYLIGSNSFAINGEGTN